MRQDDHTYQAGVVVVRPGWLAFLPAGPSSVGHPPSPGSLTYEGPSQAWQTLYPLAMWWQQGPQIFDAEVARCAQPAPGLLVTITDGAIVQEGAKPPAFVSTRAPTAVIRASTPLPMQLLAGFRPGILPFDKKLIATRCAVISILAALLTVFAVRQEGIVGAGAAIWVVLPWAIFYWRVQKERAALRAIGNGPSPPPTAYR